VGWPQGGSEKEKIGFTFISDPHFGLVFRRARSSSLLFLGKDPDFMTAVPGLAE